MRRSLGLSVEIRVSSSISILSLRGIGDPHRTVLKNWRSVWYTLHSQQPNIQPSTAIQSVLSYMLIARIQFYRFMQPAYKKNWDFNGSSNLREALKIITPVGGRDMMMQATLSLSPRRSPTAWMFFSSVMHFWVAIGSSITFS